MGLFGSKLRIPMQAMLPPDMEDTAQGPSMATAAPTARPKGLFGSKYGGPQLNRMQVLGAMFQQLGDNRGQLNDLYQMEDQRQRAAFEQQREEAMLTALQDAAPDAVKPYVQFAPKEVLGGLIKQAFPEAQKTQGPLAIGPGTELIDRDPRTGMPIIDPATGKPRVLYSNTNYAPRNSRAPVIPFDPTAGDPDVEWEDKR